MDRAEAFTLIRIDARPRGPEGPLAAHILMGRPVLAHLIDAVPTAPEARIVVDAAAEDAERLASLVPVSKRSLVSFRIKGPETVEPLLRADRLYDPHRLRRAIDRRQPPDRAVIWRLDSPEGLAGAEAELLRRTCYQPIGRYWALEPARWIARRLERTRARPNHLTLASFASMLLAAALVATARPGFLAAIALAAGLVLDTADGHLARLQGTATDFGRWLDGLLDEVADQALHLAIGWAVFMRDGNPAWLVVAASYLAGKHLFLQSCADWERIRGAATSGAERDAVVGSPGPRLLRGMAHADLRWHLWIVSAAIGRLDLALLLYAAYYPARTAAGVFTKRRATAHASA